MKITKKQLVKIIKEETKLKSKFIGKNVIVQQIPRDSSGGWVGTDNHGWTISPRSHDEQILSVRTAWIGKIIKAKKRYSSLTKDDDFRQHDFVILFADGKVVKAPGYYLKLLKK